jgi:cell division protein FtsQ
LYNKLDWVGLAQVFSNGVIFVHEIKKKVYRRKKKKPGSLKWLMPLVVLLLFVVAGYFFIHSSFFAVSSITVSGSKNVRSTEIVKISGLHQGENIFQTDLAKAKEKIMTEALIKTVNIERKLPAGILISVTERVPVALLPVVGGLLQVDAQGKVLSKQGMLEGKGLTIITGITVPSATGVGNVIKSAQLQTGLKLISQMDTEAQKIVGEIDISNPQKLRAYTLQGAEIRLGSGEEIKEKFDRFLQVMSEEEKLKKMDEIQYIDVSFSGKPVVFYRK